MEEEAREGEARGGEPKEGEVMEGGSEGRKELRRSQGLGCARPVATEGRALPMGWSSIVSVFGRSACFPSCACAGVDSGSGLGLGLSLGLGLDLGLDLGLGSGSGAGRRA